MSFSAIVFVRAVAVGKQLYCTTGRSLEMVLNLELSLLERAGVHGRAR